MAGLFQATIDEICKLTARQKDKTESVEKESPGVCEAPKCL